MWNHPTREVAEHLLVPPEPAVFGAAEWEDLPDPVSRYLRAAIAPGTPLATSVRLRMRGAIKLRRWLPFRAYQVLAPHRGFEWRARVAAVITGYDRYLDGHGEMHWELLRLETVAHASGPDVSRSAAGRAAAEALWIPTALLPRFGVTWTADDDRHVRARYRLHDTPIEVRYRLDDHARPVAVVFDRWGDPDGTGVYGWHPFGVEVSGHARFGGLTIPHVGTAGWFFGTPRWDDGAFFRYRITGLHVPTSHDPRSPA